MLSKNFIILTNSLCLGVDDVKGPFGSKLGQSLPVVLQSLKPISQKIINSRYDAIICTFQLTVVNKSNYLKQYNY